MTPAAGYDRRMTPARKDLAAAFLEGSVDAERFVAPRSMRVTAPSTPLRREPRFDAPLDTEALYGEELDAYEINDEGWAWVQLRMDGYVGYVPAADIAERHVSPTHRVAVPRTFVYPGPNIKLVPDAALPFGAMLEIERHDGLFAVTTGRAHVLARHLVPLENRATDIAATASAFVGAPYLWGGRTSLGLDCSALVQLSFQAAGIACPRDSDMQEKSVGSPLPDMDSGALRRGDLVFWKGHVGMMRDAAELVHASGHHMLVVVEPLAQAVARIAQTGGSITAMRRPIAVDRGRSPSDECAEFDVRITKTPN